MKRKTVLNRNSVVFSPLLRLLLLVVMSLPAWQMANAGYNNQAKPWAFGGVRHGCCNPEDNKTFPYNGLNNTGQCYEQSTDGYFGYYSNPPKDPKGQKTICYYYFKHSVKLPPYAKQVMTWKYFQCIGADTDYARSSLYHFDDEETLKNTYVSNDPASSAANDPTSKQYLMHEYSWSSFGGNSTKEHTDDFVFDNSTSGQTNDVYQYIMIVYAQYRPNEKGGTVFTYIGTRDNTYYYSKIYYPRFNGDGTKDSPLQITSGSDLKAFAQIVNSGFEGTESLYAVLTSDIDYTPYTDSTAMIGTPDHPYKGVFDGQGHSVQTAFNVSYTDGTGAGLFRRVSGATIKNLSLSGTATAYNYFGTVVGIAQGNVLLENVLSSVKITATNNGDISSGGLVSVTDNNSSVVFKNCGFRGAILSENGGYSAGGLLGWCRSGAKAEFTNCYFAPSEVTVGNSNSCTFCRYGGDRPKLTNCYYSYQLGEAQGTQVTDEQMASGEVCFRLNGSKDNGTPWLQTIGTDLSPVLTDALHVYGKSGAYYNFQPSFPGAGTEADPFELETAQDLMTFRDIINAGYNNLCARLVANIDLADYNWEPIDNYTGTFDGKGFIISNLNVNQLDSTQDKAGLFGYVRGATIKNIIIHNATVKGVNAKLLAAPLVGYMSDSTGISNCGVYGVVKLSGYKNSGLVYNEKQLTDATYISNSYTVYDNITYAGASYTTNCYYGTDVANKCHTGELTYLLNNGSPTPWVQNIGENDYPQLRNALSVYKNSSGYYNEAYSGSEEAAFVEAISRKDFRVIHHGGRLYEFVITMATQDSKGIFTCPDAQISYNADGKWTKIFTLSDINKDELAFSQDWWGKIDVAKGTTYDTKTYHTQVPTFWIRQGNHTDCKKTSLLWLAPEDITSLPSKFQFCGVAEDSQLNINSNTESPASPGDDASVSMVDPVLGMTQNIAGHQLAIVTATNNAYSSAVWDATDNQFVWVDTNPQGYVTVNIDLPQIESNHDMVALVYAKDILTDSKGNSDTTHTNYSFPFVEKPTHSIMRNNISQTYNATGQIEWAIAFPNDTDMIDDDVYVVARGYQSSYSDISTLVSFKRGEYARTTTENDTLFGWYSFMDTTLVDYSQLVTTDDTLSAFDTWNISDAAKQALNEYKYPSRYLYYQVYRPTVTSLWSEHDKFYRNWKMLQTVVLPTVDSVRIIKDDNYDSNHKVTVRVVLNNPYPWDVVSAEDHDKVFEEAQKQLFDHRMFQWDEKASITLERFSTSEEYDEGTDVIKKIITITGDQIKQDSKTGAFYVEYQDIASVPFVHYYYRAKVNTDEADYPICEDRNDFCISTDECYSEQFGIVSNLQATRGTLTGAVELTWEADEFSGTTLELKRRQYQRGWESEPSLGEWTTIEATGGQAMDDIATAAVVNEYILTITTKYRDNVWTQSDTTYGYSGYYGKLNGRVQMSNGVNMPGNVSVTVNSDDAFALQEVRDPRNSEVVLPAYIIDKVNFTLTTDKSGAYELDSVPFYGTGRNYTVYAACEGATFVSPTGSAATITLTYEDANYEYTDIDFTCNDTKQFSGRVLFSNSTAPVRDAYVIVNGSVLRNADGEPVVTDAMGNFSFIVPRIEVTVQLCKPGHELTNGGYILGGENADQRTFTPTQDYAGLLIYDDTKVRLVGRVAGGDIQGKKPLGFGQSRNNLGDSITLVLQLEGDHTSYLYFDKKDPDKTSYNQQFTQTVMTDRGTEQRIPTDVSFEAKRIVVKADNATGEFCLDLFPAKYIISQVYANGYSTLYSEGEGSLVVDLSDSVGVHTHYYDTTTTYTQYDASLSKIYHAPVQVDVLQLRDNKFQPVYGAESVDVEMISGAHIMQMSWLDSLDLAHYTLSYPLFKGNSYYYFQVRAYEPYYYNNQTTGRYERAPMKGYPVTVHNGLSDESFDDVTLGDMGTAMFIVKPTNTTFSMTEEDALRYLSASVEINGYHYESEQIAGFVTGEKDYGVDVAGAYESTPTLIDYIRDPYGAGSYAYREAGTKYSWSHHLSSTTKDVLITSLSTGVGITSSVGLVVQQTANYSVKVSSNMNFILTNDTYLQDGEMSMTLSERLSTSSDPGDQGAMADVYLGNISTMDIYHFKTINVLDSLSYSVIRQAVEGGVARLIREGRNASGELTYLVICDGTSFEMGEERVFAYTQKHIIETLIPALEARRDEAFRIAPDAEQAKQMCLNSGRIVYYKSGDSYSYYYPATSSAVRDTVEMLNNQIDAWKQLISDNEKIKVDIMTETPTNAYSLSGTTVQHTESASTYFRVRSQEGSKPVTVDISAGAGETNAQTKPEAKPATAGTDNSNSNSNSNTNSNTNNNTNQNNSANPAPSITALQDPIIRKADSEPGNGTGIMGYGLLFNISVGYSQTGSGSNTYSDYVATTGASGYVIDATGSSYFDVDVYHESDQSVMSVSEALKSDINSYETGKTDGSKLDTGTSGSITMTDDNSTIHSYIYVMRSGATRNPWIDADSTYFYQPNGARLPLGTRTMRIDNPQIYVENPVVHNTPQDEAAVFTVRLTNETEMAGNYEGSAATMILKVKDKTNPYGARIYVDGQAIGNGLEYSIAPGQAITKTVEVERGGKPYDYENIVLTLADKSYSIVDEAPISVYYLPTSTPVTLTQPAQNFLINTLSQTDEDGKYYIPVQIEGFSTTKYDNFDHIELQYKRQTDGEDQWVNQCSYFADEKLYAAASGTKAMIETEGKISDIRFYGEQDPVEQKYDLRVVSFCRLGNGYTTRNSSIISGTKDTRCPEVFGLPKPQDGILDFDDVISLPFTEPIAYNYLDETANFSVQGYTNNSDADNSVSLYFAGTDAQSAATSVDRILNSMDFSVEMNIKVDDGAAGQMQLMTISDDYSEDASKAFVFGYNADEDVLIALMNGQRVATKPIKATYGINLASAMTHVGMVYSVADSTVRFYISEQEVYLADEYSDLRLECHANGVVSLGTGYQGRMNNIRLWSKALSNYEMYSKYKKVLSANEANLLGYWPADEGIGTTVSDHANGADLALQDVSWNLPDGYSVDLDNKAMDILYDQALKYTRDDDEDYTISFYFKVDELTGDANLFAAGSDALEETGMNKVRIRFIDGKLCFVSEGQQYTFGDNDLFTDATWHYLAVSVNHAQNKTALFIDGQLVNETDAESVGGVTGSTVQYGGENIHVHIDQVQMWSIALPATYIREYYNAALTGKEKELQIYLPFEREEMNDQGTMYTTFSAYNHVIPEGTTEIAGDTAFNETLVVADSKVISPVRSSTGIENLPFRWKSTENELQIEITKSNADINNQQINLVVRRVEDLNGNPMQNAQMWTTYVNRNVLTWNNETRAIVLTYGSDTTFAASFGNASGRKLNYTVDCTSPYIELSNTMGTIEPLGSHSVIVSISDGAAPGVYETTINLTDEDGLCNPLTLNVLVKAEEPDWQVTTDASYNQSMDVIGVVKKQNDGVWSIDMCKKDKVAAFIDNECVGVANITVDATGNNSHLYMTVHGKSDLAGASVEFRLWSALDGNTYILDVTPDVTFASKSIIGRNTPVEMLAYEMRVQTISLSKGWNWISLFVDPFADKGLNDLFSNQKELTVNDVFRTPFGSDFATYQSDGTWDETMDELLLEKDNVYQIYAQNEATVEVSGSLYENPSVTLDFSQSEWAQLAYLCEKSLPIRQALSDFVAGSESAPAGTIVKGYNSFAVANADGTWAGSLEYVRPGEGYFVCRNGLRDNVTIHYTKGISSSSTKSAIAPVYSEHPDMMPLIAAFADGDLQQGDRLLALVGNEVIAVAEATEGIFFVSLHAKQGEPIVFAKERNGEIVAVTTKGFSFDAQGVAGSMEHPYLIDFTEADSDAPIYDIQGIKYDKIETGVPRVFIQGSKKTINY